MALGLLLVCPTSKVSFRPERGEALIPRQLEKRWKHLLCCAKMSSGEDSCLLKALSQKQHLKVTSSRTPLNKQMIRHTVEAIEVWCSVFILVLGSSKRELWVTRGLGHERGQQGLRAKLWTWLCGDTTAPRSFLVSSICWFRYRSDSREPTRDRLYTEVPPTSVWL